MAFFNTPVVALLLSLSIVVAPAAAYTTIAQGPISSLDEASSFHAENSFVIPKEEQDKDCQYLKAQMAAAANKVELFLANEVEMQLKGAAGFEKECLDTCKHVYENAVFDLKKAIESVSAADFFSANTDVSAFMTDIITCNESFNGFEKFNDWAQAAPVIVFARSLNTTNFINFEIIRIN